MKLKEQFKTTGLVFLAIVFYTLGLPYLISSDDWILFGLGVIILIFGLVNVGYFIFEKVRESK